MEQSTNQIQVLIGSNTSDKQIQSVFHYDPNKQTANSILSCINPTYICAFQKWIYIVSQSDNGQIITLNQKFQILSRVSTLGKSPCHISVNSDGSYITVCNYSSGSVAMYITQNHIPTKIRCFMTHEGHSTNAERQSSPHPHCSVFSPQDTELFVTDLGTDVIYFYSISQKQIKAEKEKSIKIPGSGPRTICHGPKDQKRLFLSCQLDNTIRVLSYQKDSLQLLAAYRISSNIQNFPSQVLYWKNQVYIALRGDDRIIVFDDKKDKLQQTIAFKVGKWPRHFTITDYGVMYIACQKEDKVYRYLFKEQKILQIGELHITNPTVVALLPQRQIENTN